MPFLTTPQRKQVVKRWMDDNVETVAAQKPELLECVDSFDVFCDDNQATFLLQIPQATRTRMNLKQKLRIMRDTLTKRIEAL